MPLEDAVDGAPVPPFELHLRRRGGGGFPAPLSEGERDVGEERAVKAPWIVEPELEDGGRRAGGGGGGVGGGVDDGVNGGVDDGAGVGCASW